MPYLKIPFLLSSISVIKVSISLLSITSGVLVLRPNLEKKIMIKYLITISIRNTLLKVIYLGLTF